MTLAVVNRQTQTRREKKNLWVRVRVPNAKPQPVVDCSQISIAAPLPLPICWLCLSRDPSFLGLLPLHLGAADEMKTRARTSISRGIPFFFSFSLLNLSRGQAIQCLGRKCKDAKMQTREKRPALRGMRSDIISTSRLEPKWDFLWQNRQAAPTLPMAAGIGQCERGETAHGTGADEAWTSMEACPVAKDREGSAVPAVSAPFLFPVPRPPGPPRLHVHTLHSHTCWKSCPLLLELMFPWSGPSFFALHRHQTKPTSTTWPPTRTGPDDRRRHRRRRRPRHRPPEPASTL